MDIQIFGIDIDLEAINKNVDKRNTLICSSAEECIEATNSPFIIPKFALRSSFDVISIETPGIIDVDIVKLSCDELDNDSRFKSIKLFNDNQLAHV